MEENRVEPII